MKKLRELFPLNDRTKMIVSAAAAGAVLLLAMLLPLGFRVQPEQGSAGATELVDKSAMFAQYWVRGADACGYGISRPEKISGEMQERCETVMRTLTARCINDGALERTEPTGREYTVISDGTTELKLCRMWLEARGDWQNWLDVCFDAESGEVYYLYVSRECLNSLHDYADTAQPPDAASLAETLAVEYGWTLRWVNADGDGTACAVFGTDHGTVCYQIDCRIFDKLIDIKLCCR